MMTIPAGRDLAALIKLCKTANQPLLLEAGPGVGECAITEATAREMKIDCVVRSLASLEPTDLVGLRHIQRGRTVVCPPAFLPSRGSGILLLKNLHLASDAVRSLGLELLSQRCLGDYELPPGWLPIATFNPSGGQTLEELNPALLSRFVRARVVPDPASWLTWAKSAGIAPSVQHYVASDPNVFDDPKSHPRAWAQVSALVEANTNAMLPDHLFQVAVADMIGPERAASFFRVRPNGEQPLTAHEILADYERQQARVRKWVKGKSADLLASTLVTLEKHLQSELEFTAMRESPKAWANLGRFLSDLPRDLNKYAVAFFLDRGYQVPPGKQE